MEEKIRLIYYLKMPKFDYFYIKTNLIIQLGGKYVIKNI